MDRIAGAVLVLGASLFAAVPAAAQPSAAVSAREIPRTSWGDPDLQGIWVVSTLTPLERSSEYQGREFLTAEKSRRSRRSRSPRRNAG